MRPFLTVRASAVMLPNSTKYSQFCDFAAASKKAHENANEIVATVLRYWGSPPGHPSWRFTAPCAGRDVTSPHVAGLFPDAQTATAAPAAVGFPTRISVLVGPGPSGLNGAGDSCAHSSDAGRGAHGSVHDSLDIERWEPRRSAPSTRSFEQLVRLAVIGVREGDDGFLATPPPRGTAVARMA